MLIFERTFGKIVGEKSSYEKKWSQKGKIYWRRMLEREGDYLGKGMLGRAEFQKELSPSLPRITAYFFY
jgi:hypothetical protein